MAFWKKWLHSGSKARTFTADPPGETAWLEVDGHRHSAPGSVDVRRAVEAVHQGNAPYVILQLPAAVHGIRYVQACQHPEGLSVELGLEKRGRIRLVEKVMDCASALRLFDTFLQSGTVADADSFDAVQFPS